MDDLRSPFFIAGVILLVAGLVVTFATESSAGIYLNLAAALVMIVGPALAKRDRRG